MWSPSMDSLNKTKLGALGTNIERGHGVWRHRQVNEWDGESWVPWLESEEQKVRETEEQKSAWDRNTGLF